MSIWGDPFYLMRIGSVIPSVSNIRNVGITDVGYNRVRFYSTDGGALWKTEYVADGDDCKYGSVDSLLVATDSSSILTENKGEDYVSGTSTWGDFTLIGSGFSKNNDCVAFTTSSYGTYDLTSANQSVTVYAVVQQYGSTSGSQCLLYTWHASSTGNAPGFFSNNGTLYTSYYSSDVSTGKAATDIHVLVLRIDGSHKSATYYLDGAQCDSKTFNNSGAQVQIAGFPNNVYSANAYFSYVAVVNGAEDNASIIANSNYIKAYYLDNIRSYDWAISANSGISVPNITKNVQSNLDLYLARWAVTYCNNSGSIVSYVEYVRDGSDAIWGAGQDWSSTPDGSAVIGILENVHSNITVYSVANYLQYIRTNYSNFTITLSNWVYDLGDTWELTFKQEGTPQKNGDWPAIICTTISGSAKLFIQYNLWNGRNVINMAYNGGWAGDSTASYNSPYDYVNYYKLVCAAGHFALYKGSTLDNISTVAFTFNFNSGSGSTNLPVILFPLNSSYRLDNNFYNLVVYRNGTKIHDYYPIADGVSDAITGTFYTVSTTGHINGPPA